MDNVELEITSGVISFELKKQKKLHLFPRETLASIL